MVFENAGKDILKSAVIPPGLHLCSTSDIFRLIFSHTDFPVSFKHSVKIFHIRKSQIITDILNVQLRKMQQSAGIQYLSHFLELKNCISAPVYDFPVQRHCSHTHGFCVLFQRDGLTRIQKYSLDDIPHLILLYPLFFFRSIAYRQYNT